MVSKRASNSILGLAYNNLSSQARSQRAAVAASAYLPSTSSLRCFSSSSSSSTNPSSSSSSSSSSRSRLSNCSCSVPSSHGRQQTQTRSLSYSIQAHQPKPSPSSGSTSSPSMRSGPTSFSAPPPLPSSKSPSASSSASPSSSSPSKSGPIPSPTLGTDLTPERILSHFQQPPFPSQNVLGNDSEIATRAMTHESYKYGKEGQNRRLAFLGRRSLKLSLTLFLHTLSTSPKTSQSTKDWALKLLSDPPKVEEMITTQKLGDRIGRELGLEKVMRWTPALSDGQFGPKETGLFKVRGVCLEALLGAILHNSGADKARLFFNSKVLPSLVEQFFPEDTPTEAKELCETLANEAGESL